jgi:hypothetical protein
LVVDAARVVAGMNFVRERERSKGSKGDEREENTLH